MRRFSENCTKVKFFAFEIFGLVSFFILLAAFLWFEWNHVILVFR
jgi:hypothetical protein